MENIKVAVSDLLTQLKTNREKHVIEYDEAMVAYRETMVKELSKLLKSAKKGADINHVVNVLRPVSFVDSYNEAIAMMEWTIDSEVDLSMHDFKCYVQDVWSWKHQFNSITSSYKI